jgi:hypothetical protein
MVKWLSHQPTTVVQQKKKKKKKKKKTKPAIPKRFQSNYCFIRLKHPFITTFDENQSDSLSINRFIIIK